MVYFNSLKTKLLTMKRNNAVNHLSLIMTDYDLPESFFFCLLGLSFCKDLFWTNYITSIISKSVWLLLSSHLQSFSHRQLVESLSLFHKYFHGWCSFKFSDLIPPVKTFTHNTCLATNSHILTVVLPKCNQKFYQESFPRTSAAWNSHQSSCFPDLYNL